MELNLDRLNNLRFTDFQEKQPSTTPTEPLLEGEEYKTAEQEHALKRQIEGLGSLQRKANQNKAKAFEDFLLSDDGQAILENYGFKKAN